MRLSSASQMVGKFSRQYDIKKQLLNESYSMGTIFCYKNELTFLSFTLVLLFASVHNVISGKNSKHNMMVISEMFIRD